MTITIQLKNVEVWVVVSRETLLVFASIILHGLQPNLVFHCTTDCKLVQFRCTQPRATPVAILIPVATVTNSARRWAEFGFNAAEDGEKKHVKYVFPIQMNTRDERGWACLIPPQKSVSRSPCTESMDPGSSCPLVVLTRRGVRT